MINRVLQSLLVLPDQVFASYYWFERRGSGLPMHCHSEPLQHDVICTHGRVRVINGEWSQVLQAGEGMQFEDPATPHEIVALEDGSATLHEYLKGMPAEVASYGPSDWHGWRELGPLLYPLKGLTDDR